MSGQTQQQQQQQGLDITTLPTAQLSQLQSRLSSELEHLSTSHARLRAAQTRFKDCIRSIADGVENKPAGTLHVHPNIKLRTYLFLLTLYTTHQPTIEQSNHQTNPQPRNPPPNPPNDLPLRPRPSQPQKTQHRPRRRRNRVLRRENH